MIDEQDIARIQEQLGELSLRVVKVDLDGFLEATVAVGSPQALAAGIDPRAVTSAGGWTELARLLKPFRDHSVRQLAAIHKQRTPMSDLVDETDGCPSCLERRIDQLTIQDDASVLCGTCSRRYKPGAKGGSE